jgi:hypothetical protein
MTLANETCTALGHCSRRDSALGWFFDIVGAFREAIPHSENS